MEPGRTSRPRRRTRSARWPARVALAFMVLAAGSSCSTGTRSPASLDPGKVASVVVGRSSKADVLSTLGPPTRTERSAQGEAWIYEAKDDDAGGQDLMSGVAAVSGIVGAFVPYAGLVGSGLGLAGTAAGTARSRPKDASLAVIFGDEGVVRECVYSSTAPPSGGPGAAPGAPGVVDCQRPRPAAVPPRPQQDEAGWDR